MQIHRLPLIAAIGLASTLACAQSSTPSSAGAAPQATPPAGSAAPSGAQATGAPSVQPGTPGNSKRIVTPSGGATADKAAAGQAGASTAKADPAAAPAQRSKGTAAPNPENRPRQLQTLYAGVMTDEESTAYLAKLREAKTYAECKSLLEATHAAMEPRAKAQGKTLPATPTEACDRAKARGRLKG